MPFEPQLKQKYHKYSELGTYFTCVPCNLNFKTKKDIVEHCKMKHILEQLGYLDEVVFSK